MQAPSDNSRVQPDFQVRPPAYQELLATIRDWQIWDDREIRTADEGVSRDVELGHAVAARKTGPTFRLWENRQALIVSRKERQLPQFSRAVEIMAADGWPVIVRDTGGTAVPHGPGILQLSLVIPRSAVMAFSTDAVYELLCQPLQYALSELGIPTEFGSVPEAFCDGRFNLVAAGRKIAGTAQAWRANVFHLGDVREGYVLAHASLFVRMDTRLATDAVNRFYKLSASSNKYSYNAVTTVDSFLKACKSESLQLGTESLVSRTRNLILDGLAHTLEYKGDESTVAANTFTV